MFRLLRFRLLRFRVLSGTILALLLATSQASASTSELVYYGIDIGHTTLDMDTPFTIGNQTINMHFKDSEQSNKVFLGVPFNDLFAIEFAVFQLGFYDITGTISNTTVDNTFSGNREYRGFSESLVVRKSFKYGLGASFSAGISQMYVKSNFDLASTPDTLEDDSLNAIVGLNLWKKFAKRWYVGPSWSYVDFGDKISQVSLRLSVDVD